MTQTVEEKGKTPISYLMATLMAFSLNMMGLGEVFFLRDLRGASSLQIGSYVCIFWIAYVVGCLLVQPRMRHVSAVVLLLSSMIGMGGIAIAILLTHTIWGFFIIAAIKGVIMSHFWPVIMGWVSAGLEGKALNRRLGRFNLSWNLGIVSGPLIGGILSDIRGEWPMFLAVVCFLGGGTAMLILCLKHREVFVFKGEQRRRKQTTSLAEDRSTPLRFPAWIGMLAAFVACGIMVSIFPLIATEQLAISKAEAGSLLTYRSLAMTATFATLARMNWWHDRIWPMAIGLIILAGSQLLLMHSGNGIWLSLVVCLTGIQTSLAYNQSLFHGASGAIDRTTRMAIHESLLGAGFGIGAVLGGWLYAAHGADITFLVTAVILVIAASLQFLFSISSKLKSHRPSELDLVIEDR